MQSSASPSSSGTPRWSSQLAFYLGSAGAAVGLGSIWRFPYLAGSGGGSAFIIVFVAACLFIATPLLVAEFAMGRKSRRSPPEAAGACANEFGLSSRWNIIGVLGAVSAFLLVSYYTVIAGWTMAYAWKSAAGVLVEAGPRGVGQVWREFLSRPLEVGFWHVLFMLLLAMISARGLHRGIEFANRIRGPGLLILLCILVTYALITGDVPHGLRFAFEPDMSALNSQVILTAIGQAFYATGVGQAMMIAYGAYVVPGTSLVRTSLIITAAILVVSLLATLLVFPLVFAYGMDPAQGPALVFEVLPRAFAEMPAGRAVGTLFFLLLVLAALMPSVALLEPSVAWLVQKRGLSRKAAAWSTTGAAWLLGLGSVMSFNLLSNWHPLALLKHFEKMTFFGVMDYVSSDILLPVGALLTSILVGWRISGILVDTEAAGTTALSQRACIWLLRYICPVAIAAIFIATLV